MASYSYDLLGRGTQINYTGGGSDAWTYTRDGRIASKNMETLSYDKIGNITQWNSNGVDGAVSYSYAGTHGSKALGLPSASTGTGNIGSYAYTYNTKYLLHTMADTSKIAQSYTYSYSTAKQITGLLYPNQTSTSYVYDNKQLDSIQVQQVNVNPPINWLATDSTYNSDGQRTAYSFSVTNGQGGSFAESHDFGYDTAGRMTSVDYQNTQRTVDLSYNANTGLMNELDYSDLGTYTLSHDTAGRLSSITYPDTTQEAYSYQGGLGRLSQIQYPNNQSLGFSWDSQGQISQLQANDNGTPTNFAFSYNTRGKLASYTKTEGGITTEQWYLFHGPQGLEKAQRLQYGMLNLTLDFTTDPRGNILSMTHTPSGGAQGYTGEVYFHYDNAGNTSLLTNASGVPLASFQHDPISRIAINEWNPQNITFPWIGGGSAGGITIRTKDSWYRWVSIDQFNEWELMQESLKRVKLMDVGTINPDIFGGKVDMCCFNSCWAWSTKDKGWRIENGQWVQKGQFMSGNWGKDIETYMSFVKIASKDSERSGDKVSWIARWVAIFNYVWPYLGKVGLGVKAGLAILGMIIDFLISLVSPPDITALKIATQNNMGRNTDHANENFWTHVDFCYNSCLKEPVTDPSSNKHSHVLA